MFFRDECLVLHLAWLARFCKAAEGPRECPSTVEGVCTTFLLVLEAQDGVSSPGESHPEALVELYVSLSTHTAPSMEPRRTPICQWANSSGARREIRAIQCVALRRCWCSFLYLRLAQRARSRSSSRIVG